MAGKTAKEPRLPKGVGRVPQWWIEITPHDTLYIEDDEAKRFQEEEEKKMYAKLAAMDDLLQKYGGEGFPDWDPGMHGPRTPEEEEEWVKTGYQRNTKTGIWENESGEPLTGRQFEGVLPPGYTPGEFSGAGGDSGGAEGGGGGPGFGQGQLNSTEGKYGRDDQRQWDKPDWMKVKLRSTKKVTPATPEAAAPEPTPAPPVADEGEDEVIEEEEVAEEETGDEFGGTMVKKIRRKKSVNSYTSSSSSSSSPPPTNTTSNGGASNNVVKASRPTPSQLPPETGGSRIDSDLQRKMEARRAKEKSGVSTIDKPTKAATSKQPRLDSDLQRQLLARRQKEEAAAAAEEEGIIEEEIVEEVFVEE